MILQKKIKSGRPTTMRRPWAQLSALMDGYKNLAVHFGVGTSTITKWASGVHRMPVLAKKELERLCKHYRIKNPNN